MIDVFILGGIAAFVLYRLYRTLGEDDGPPEGRSRHTVVTPLPKAEERRKPAAGNASPLGEPKSRFTGPAAAGLREINGLDKNFDQKEFLIGAEHFYKMIVEAFQNGDKDSLTPWLDDDVKEAWFADIDARNASYVPWKIRQFRFADIEAASVSDNVARIDVRFDASLSRDGKTQRVQEVWTLMRNLSSDSPNWILDDVEAAT